MKARIAISSNTMWSIVNFRSRLIHSLIERGHEVTVFAPMDKHASRLVHPRCKLVHLPIEGHGTNPIRELKLLAQYLRALARERPSIYLGFTVKPNVYGSMAARLLGIPVINNITGLGRVFLRPGPVTRIVQHLYRLALARSRVVFFQNEDDRKMFLELGLVRQAQADLLPGSGVDLTHFSPSAAMGPIPWPDAGRTGFCFLMLSRLLRDKGVEEYARAARIVHRRFPQVRCLLLGNIDDSNPDTIPRESLAQWESEQLIEYLGEADDVRPYIAGADCVVLPSWYREGVPRSLLEAGAMAKPVITTDSVGCRDAVSDRLNGLLCKAGDAEDLAMKMIEMLRFDTQKRLRMGAAGRRKMEASFDDRIVIGRTIDAIDHCLQAPAAAPHANGYQTMKRGPE